MDIEQKLDTHMAGDLTMKKESTWAASAPEDNGTQRLNPTWVCFVNTAKQTLTELEARHVINYTDGEASTYDCLLNGLIICPLCGARMFCVENQQDEQKDVHLWSFAPCRLQCSQSEASAKSCPMPYFSGTEAERFVLRAVEEELNFGQHRRDVLVAYGQADFYNPIEHRMLSAEVTALEAEGLTIAQAHVDAIIADENTDEDGDYPSFIQEIRRVGQQKKEAKAKIAILVKQKQQEALTLLQAERHMAAFFHNLSISDSRRNEALTKIIDKIVPHERKGDGWIYEVAFRAAT